MEEEREWNRRNKLTSLLHVRLDKNGEPRSARVIEGDWKNPEILAMEAEEIFELRRECRRARNRDSYDYLKDVLKKFGNPEQVSRVKDTQYLVYVTNEDKTVARKAYFRNQPRFRSLFLRDIASLDDNEVNGCLEFFDNDDKASARVARDVLGLRRDTGNGSDGTAYEGPPKEKTRTQPFTGLSRMSVRDAAEVLGLKIEAPATLVQQRAKSLQQLLHPDKGGTDRLSQLVNEARNVLARDRHRESADETRAPDQAPGRMSPSEAADVLGLKEGSGEREVKASARRLLGLVHPDAEGSRRLEQLVTQARELMLREAEREE